MYRPIPHISTRLGVERKHIDSLYTDVIDSNGVIFRTLVPLSLGFDQNQRVGNTVTGTSFIMRFCVCWPNQSSVTLAGLMTTDTCRIMVYLDKQCNGTAATVTDILDSANVNDFRFIPNLTRFSILKTFFVQMNSEVNHDGTNYISSGYVESLSCVLNTPWIFKYTEGGGSIANLVSYNIGFMAITRNNALCDILGFSRFYYTDV